MVMVVQLIAASGGNGVKLMIRQMGESTTGGGEGVEEGVIGIIHLIDTERGAQTTLVEPTVVRHERQTLDERFYLSPHLAEHGCGGCIGLCESVNLGAAVGIIIGFGQNERVERVGNEAVPNDDQSYGADAAALVVGGFEINGCKVFHFLK